jgi:hypothetical protein
MFYFCENPIISPLVLRNLNRDILYLASCDSIILHGVEFESQKHRSGYHNFTQNSN